ncbi:pentapeptide repeat-containing protein [Microbacterium esteraromaticum]|uniref:pentapeptide repeat-containing protein n=1 Tax=Microbacterium esteraromaticum TaxID=57043 RepID=UPI0030B69C09
MQGDPGTGKTIIAIFLMKLLADIRDYQDHDDIQPDSAFAEFFTPPRRIAAGPTVRESWPFCCESPARSCIGHARLLPWGTGATQLLFARAERGTNSALTRYLIKDLMNHHSETFTGTDLDGKDLRGVDFTRCTFIDIDLSGDLTGATFCESRFERGTITGADCQRADFSFATFEGTALINVDLADAKFTGSTLSDATMLSAHLTRTDFSDAQLHNCGINFVKGEATNFSRCKIVSTTDACQGAFNIVLPVANFTQAVLDDLTWPGPDVRLPMATFIGASLKHVVFAGADLEDADFANAVFDSVIFDAANLTFAEFGGTDPDAAPRAPTLFFVPEREAPVRLRSVSFREAQLTNAVFNGVVLEECDLSGAIAEAAEFMGTRFDRCTAEGTDWTDAAPGWETTDTGVRERFFTLFWSAGMSLPYLPLDERYDVTEATPDSYRSSSWQSIGPAILDAFDPLAAELRADQIDDGFAIGVAHGERGAETWSYACRELKLSVVAQVMKHESPSSGADSIRVWDALMRGISRVFSARQDSSNAARLLIEYSEPRRCARWTWVREDHEQTTEWDGDVEDVAGFFRAAAVEALKL